MYECLLSLRVGFLTNWLVLCCQSVNLQLPNIDGALDARSQSAYARAAESRIRLFQIFHQAITLSDKHEICIL